MKTHPMILWFCFLAVLVCLQARGEDYFPISDLGIEIAISETTQAQWRRVMQTEPWQWINDAIIHLNNDKNEKDVFFNTDNSPAVFISFDSALEYCHRLSMVDEMYSYRLPTEKEWEQIANASMSNILASSGSSSAITNVAWCNTKPNGHRPTRHKQPTGFGLYDLFGNVAEWCMDDGEECSGVLKGGGFDQDVSKMNVTFREVLPKSAAAWRTGFRVVREVKSSSLGNHILSSLQLETVDGAQVGEHWKCVPARLRAPVDGRDFVADLLVKPADGKDLPADGKDHPTETR